RTSQLMEEFARSFDAADRLILAGVYSPPPEKPIPGVSGKRLAELARERLGDRVEYVPRLEDVVDRLFALAQEGDIVVTMGDGDVWRVAHACAQRRQRKGMLRAEEHPPMEIWYHPENREVLNRLAAAALDAKELFDLKTAAERLSLLDGFDRLLSLEILDIQLFHHQEQAVRKVLQEMRGRAILADEVGLGKTI